MKKQYKNHRRIWEKHWGAIPDGHHIHHIDGDKHNNDISNLLCVSALEHMMIHRIQGDVAAYNILAMQVKRPRLPVSAETRAKISASKKGCKGNPKSTEIIRALGKLPKTEEFKEAQRANQKESWANNHEYRCKAMRGKRKVVGCPHCSVKGGGGNMRRYHFDNCKQKTDIMNKLNE